MISPILGLVEFLTLIALAVLGVPISVAMGFVGLSFAFIFYGSSLPAVMLAGLTAWYQSANYTVTMIPLFIFMGTLLSTCGLGKDAYDSFYKWLLKIRGSIAIVTVVTCGAFAGITGSSTATVAAVGGVSVPEMKRFGYSKSLRTGSIAAAGTFGILIPPSIAMVFYGILAETSIGRLFIAGIIPGIITVLLYSMVVFAWVRLRPDSAPLSHETFSFREKVISLKGPVPIFMIFLFMVWGIYTGIFSPTEAAGIGVFCSVVVVLLMRRLTPGRFVLAAGDALKITAMIMLLIMGAMLFAHTIAITGFPKLVANTIIGSGLSPYATIFSIIGAGLFLGCVLSGLALMVLTVPLFIPIILAMGYDLVWFGVVTIVLVELALVTPPVAANLYVAQSLDPDVTSMDVIKGIIPFFAADFTVLALIVFFPQICLFLPSQMMG